MATTTTATVPGAEPWAATGEGDRARVGVVCVHGLTGNPNSTRPVAERLHREGYSVAVPLLPGHGTSVRDMARTRYPDWRRATDEAVDDALERHEQIVLVGLSMGGTLVLDVASARNDDVAGVATINVQILDPDQLLAKLAPLLQYVAPVVPRDLAGLPSDDIAKPGGDERAYGKVSAKAARSLIRELPRIRAQLADLTVPLLVAHAPQDHTVPARNSLAVPGLVGSDDVTELVLERSYHVATLDYDAELLEDEITAFVARVTGI